MATDKDVALSIGVDDAGLKAGMERAQDIVKNASMQMQDGMKGVVSRFNEAKGAFMAFTAIVAGGAAFKAVINASAEWAGEAGKLSKALGITIENASVMNVALNHLGIESDVLVSASQKMSKQIFSNSEAFETMGVKVRDSAGNYRPVTEVMGEVNAKLLEIKNPIAQNIAGQQIYGKGWADVKGILRLTEDQMVSAEKRAKALGLVVGPEGAAQAKLYKEQMRDLNLVGKSLEIQFGNAMLPVFQKLGSFMSQEGPIAGRTFGLVIEGIGFAAAATWLALKDMGDGLGALAAQSAALLRGDFEGAKVIGVARDAEASKNKAAYEKLKAGFGTSPSPVVKAPEVGGSGPDYDFAGKSKNRSKDKKAKADPSRMSAWEAELTSQKAAYELQNAEAGTFQQYTLTQELAFWEKKQSIGKLNAAEQVATQKKVGELRLQILRKDHEAEMQIDAINVEQAKNVGLARVDADEQAARLEVALGNQTDEKLLEQEQVFEDRRHAIRVQALQEKFLLAAQDPERNKVELAKQAAEAEQLEIQHQAKLAEIRGKVAVANANPFSSFLTSAQSSFGQFASNMLMRTQTLAQGMAQLYKQMATSFIADFIVKKSMAMAGDAAKEIALRSSVLSTIFGLNAAGAVNTVVAKKAEAAGVIPAEAATAAGGAAAAVAGIPIVGPAMAVAAFGETMALVMSGLGVASAAGGYDIPAGVNPMTQLHQREMVLPAKHADVIRAMADGTGRARVAEGGDSGQVHGGHTINYHDHSGRLSKQAIRENVSVIADELGRLDRNFWSTRNFRRV